jgi:hypothetical protein
LRAASQERCDHAAQVPRQRRAFLTGSKHQEKADLNADAELIPKSKAATPNYRSYASCLGVAHSAMENWLR